MPRGHVIVITGAAAALTLAVWACGLTADFSGLEGGQRDAGADGGGADTGIDAAVDVGADGTADGAVDGGADGAADACTADSYCSSLSPQPKFCSDFDDCRYPAPWTEYLQIDGGGLLGLDSISYSKPYSLLAADFMGLEQTDLADLRTTFSSIPATASTLTFAFAIEPVSFDYMGTEMPRLVVAAIDFLDSADGGSNHLQITRVINGTIYNLALDELSPGCGSAQYASHDLTGPPLQQNQWMGVRLTVNRTAAPPTASVMLEPPGSPGDAGTTALPDTQLCTSVAASQVRIGIGSIYKRQPSASWANRFDNVTFDVR
jgi:hypothetical protein